MFTEIFALIVFISNKLNEIVFAISNRKTKTSELLLIKYINITNFFVTKSHHQVPDDVILSRKQARNQELFRAGEFSSN